MRLLRIRKLSYVIISLLLVIRFHLFGTPSLIPPSFGVSRQLVRGVPPHGCLPSPFGSMASLFIRVISVMLFASDMDGFHPTYLPTVFVGMVSPSNMPSIVSAVAFPLSVTMSSGTSLLIFSLRCVTMSWLSPHSFLSTGNHFTIEPPLLRTIPGSILRCLTSGLLVNALFWMCVSSTPLLLPITNHHLRHATEGTKWRRGDTMRKGFVTLIMAHSLLLSSLPLVVLVQLPPYFSNVWHLCWLQSIRNLMLMFWVGLDAASHSLFYALLLSAFVVLGLHTTDRSTPSTPLTSPLLKGVCQLNCFCSVSCLFFVFHVIFLVCFLVVSI